MKRYIAKEFGNYIIDKAVIYDNKKIRDVNTIASPGMNEISAVKFNEEEKEWLEENKPSIIIEEFNENEKRVI